jgi:ACS family hexuronate transporter-like MFS transporter
MIVFASAWSVFTMFHGMASSIRHLVAARFLLGTAQPANFPAGVKGVSEWFPMRERALGVGIFNAGTALGSVLAIVLTAWIARRWNWQAAFIVVGTISLVWVGVWALIYRIPRLHPRISADELALIEGDTPSDGGRHRPRCRFETC